MRMPIAIATLLFSQVARADVAAVTPPGFTCSLRPDGNAVELTCKGKGAVQSLSMRIFDTKKESVDAALDNGLSALTSSFGADITRDEKPFAVGELNGRSIDLTAKANGELTFVGRMIAATNGSLTRVGMCTGQPVTAETTRLCHDSLEAFVKMGPAVFLKATAEPSQPPTFRGKRVAIPTGCKLARSTGEAFEISCEDNSFLQVKRVDEVASAAAKYRDFLVETVPTAKADQARPCKVGGVATTCESVLAGTTAVFWVGAATVDKTPLVVQCAQPPTAKGLTPLCKKALTF